MSVAGGATPRAFSFRLEATAPGTSARAGRMRTAHGEVTTPMFMPVGTQATVRGQTRETLRAAGSQVLLANTYHLLRQPGEAVFKQFGGIHRFMAWEGPVLTDSGGFQIFSLPHACQIDENGASFRPHADAPAQRLTPESSLAGQRALGSDIMMVLDHCVPSTSSRELVAEAMHRTHRWARRSLDAHLAHPAPGRALFGIVQGACFEDLRTESAATLTSHAFDGFAIGGLAVGEGRAERERITELVAARLPADRPRYLMGVGTPIDLLEAVHRGVDMFDCILPTAWAQRGVAFTERGVRQFRRTVYRLSEEPIDPHCSCPTCQSYSKAYLHHLIKAEEVLGWHLIGVHNLYFYHRLMRDLRQSIFAGTFAELYTKLKPQLAAADPEFAPGPAPRARTSAQPRYEIVRHPRGYGSIRDTRSGETMHSVSAPIDEARALYVEQSGLTARIRAHADNSREAAPFVIWDVGLGAAANAMAAVHAIEREFAVAQAAWGARGAQPRQVRILSFENDLSALALAAAHPELFTYLDHPGPKAILTEGQWTSPTNAPVQIEWKLERGDFSARLRGTRELARPHLIFYDPFSPRANPELWTTELFAKLYARSTGELSTPAGTIPAETALYTYTCSTAVRASLLAAGFWVAQGQPTGPKLETTIALAFARKERRPSSDLKWLDQSWLDRWRRSTARRPAHEPCGRIDEHPQFQNTLAGI